MSRVEKKEDISKHEHDEIERFCEEGGLPRTDWIPGNVLVTFVIRGHDGRLEASARLEQHGERLFIEDLVVRPDLQGIGYGKKIVAAIIEEARDRKADTIWAMARAVEFFENLGFAESDNDCLRAEIIEYCRRCRDYHEKCWPRLLKRDLH